MASADNLLAPFSATTLSAFFNAFLYEGSVRTIIAIDASVRVYRYLSLRVSKPTQVDQPNPKSFRRSMTGRFTPRSGRERWIGDDKDSCHALSLLSICFSRGTGVARSSSLHEWLSDHFDTDTSQLEWSLSEQVQREQYNQFSRSRFINVFNIDLANDLGTLLNRTLKTANRYCGVNRSL